MVGGWVDVAIWIIVGHDSEEPFDDGRLDGKQFVPREVKLVVEGSAESMLKLNEAADAGMVHLLVWHDPAIGVIVGL